MTAMSKDATTEYRARRINQQTIQGAGKAVKMLLPLEGTFVGKTCDVPFERVKEAAVFHCHVFQ